MGWSCCAFSDQSTGFRQAQPASTSATLRYPGEPGAPWLAGEQSPSDGTEPKVFVCYWVPLTAPPLLIAEMDHFLPQLRASLAL